MNHGHRKVVKGFIGLIELLQSERSRFAAGPILLISSQPATQSGGKSSKQVEVACRHVKFLLQQKMNFRTVVSHPAAGYAYPTLSDVQITLDLASRVGASTIAAVGSGTALDLAKAVVQTSGRSDFEDLLLVPLTYGASLVAASSHSLLLDTQEEAIIPYPEQGKKANKICTTISNLDRSKMDTEGATEVLIAAISIALDFMYRGKGDGSSIVEILSSGVELLGSVRNLPCLSEKEQDILHDKLVNFIQQAAGSISYGLDMECRSIPLALAASLITKSFQQHSIVEFMASVVPSLCREIEEKGITNSFIEPIKYGSRGLVPLVVTTESIDTLLLEIRSNQVLWNCLDASERDFRVLLKDNLLM